MNVCGAQCNLPLKTMEKQVRSLEFHKSWHFSKFGIVWENYWELRVHLYTEVRPHQGAQQAEISRESNQNFLSYATENA